ncbi:MAG: hypothetical protein ACOC10_08880 [Bacteroidota bacterium]
MKSITLICLAYLLLPGISLFSQEDKQPTISIGYHPQYMIIHGIKMDLEIALGKGNVNSLVFAPSFYLDEASKETDYYFNTWDRRKYNKMTGFGFDLHHRYYINRKKTTNTYISYGLSFRYSDVTLKMHDWNTSVFDGNNVYMFTPGEIHFDVFKFGGDLLIGYQYLFVESMTLGIYLGAATRYGLIDDSRDGTINFNDGILDIGYTGVLPLGGISVGMKIQ